MAVTDPVDARFPECRTAWSPGWPGFPGHDNDWGLHALRHNNIFAKILRGEIPCVKVYEDDKTLAFMDVMPQADGHVLVVPKEPAREYPRSVARRRGGDDGDHAESRQGGAKGAGCAGRDAGQLNGAPAGQSVFHVHFHIIPRRDGVDMGLHARGMVDAKTLEPIAAKIRSAL